MPFTLRRATRVFKQSQQLSCRTARYSVDVLSAPEPATFAELDPKNYGVIVEDDARHRGFIAARFGRSRYGSETG